MTPALCGVHAATDSPPWDTLKADEQARGNNTQLHGGAGINT